MASNIGSIREYTSTDESSAPSRVTCKNCKVSAVPRGITSTRKSATGEKHCPNCGHIHGRDNH